MAACFNSSFLFLFNSMPLSMYYIWFIHSPLDGYAGCLHTLSLMTRAAANTWAPVSERQKPCSFGLGVGAGEKDRRVKEDAQMSGLGSCMDENRTQGIGEEQMQSNSDGQDDLALGQGPPRQEWTSPGGHMDLEGEFPHNV